MQKRTKTHDLLEFNIAFYERLLRDSPGFVDALVALGEAYTRRGWYEKGLGVDQQLTQLKGDDPLVWYNLACSYSLLKRPDDALQALQRALELGYDDLEYLIRDPDLASMRHSPKFRPFLEQYVASRSSSSSPTP